MKTSRHRSRELALQALYAWQLGGGDALEQLRALDEDAHADKALAERQKCLVKLAALAADIPPEVLMSLPSPEEIARKAEEAAARARAALTPETP